MKLTLKQKEDLITRLAESWTQNQDIRDLESFYYEAQQDYLSDLSDLELIEIAEDCGMYAENEEPAK